MKEHSSRNDPSQEPPPKLDDVWRLFRETDRQFKETDRQFKETNRQTRATDRKLNRLEQLFTGHWGRLMESLVEGDLVNILNRRGISITDTTSRLKGRLADGGNYEFDIIAHNGKELVVVEVKTTLRPDDVTRFLDKLKQLKKWVPRYADNKIYGAMAYLTENAGADTMAAERGLFIIRATGDSAAIVNHEDFQPRSW